MKTITVREFDPIYAGCSPDFTAEMMDDLCDFVQEYVSKNKDDKENILDFATFTFNKHGKILKLKNYVGVIQLRNKYQIQILPKIDFDDGDPTLSKTKKIFLKMLKSLKTLKMKQFLNANLDVAKANIYDIFISIYLTNVSYLIAKGLKLDYSIVQENINFLKGRLLINEQIKHNFVNKQRFYCEFDNYNLNRPENRLIKSTLLKLSKCTYNSNNKRTIKQLLSYMDLVDESTNIKRDIKSIKYTRDMIEYKPILEWSIMFLMNNSFTSFVGESESKSLLFPMEKVFESFVGKYVKKLYTPLGFDVTTQDKTYHLFDIPPKFQLRPDIVIRKGNKIVICDTKWKRLKNDPKNNYGISQQDMYQMFAYAHKYKTSEIFLIYPANFTSPKNIIYKSHGCIVTIKFIDLTKIL